MIRASPADKIRDAAKEARYCTGGGRGGEWSGIGAGRGNKERPRAEAVRQCVCVHLQHVRKSKSATGARGGDWGVQIGWGIWKDYSPSSVFFSGSIFLRGGGFALCSPQSD